VHEVLGASADPAGQDRRVADLAAVAARVWDSHVSVSVRNAGKAAGDHTLLASLVGSDGSKRLAGFARVHLHPHRATTARLTLSEPASGDRVVVR
jgi:hypothetical protein